MSPGVFMSKSLPYSLLAVSCLMLLSACSGNVRTPGELPVVKAPDATHNSGAVIGESSISQEAEEAVSEGCVEAWRKALKGDEEGAMKQLKELDKKYPKVITVKFMMGQVEERSGKKQEALKYYRDAVEKSRFSSMYLFKLAEAERTAGNAEEATKHYRQLILQNPQFVPAKLGLARALYDMDAKSPEARKELKEIQTLEPENKEAQELQKEFDGRITNGQAKH
jgi:tetratricopeptide (TPR) repeat protein